ncbi:MAG: SUMF1/EgtB/PvdO family nonheme iron enzyme [Akkermansiaceae bacterium]|nr:SUMF1/EgtB/PvdO family nonheme iron enzyme [Akkermansiaceae bacterium]
MNPASDDRQLGEYRLKQLLAETPLTRTWLAEQVSVSRRVLVDELKEDQDPHRDVFLRDVRAKAAVEHPLIGSVYEAVAEPGLCFFAHELLPGATLADRLQAGEPLKPARLAHVLRRIAEAHIHHASLGQATSPLGLENVHLDDQGVIRLDNLAISGPRPEDQALRDVVALGHALRHLTTDGQPGSTRMLTLLGWMCGEGIDAPISWEQVRDFSTQIEQQLTEPAPPVAATRAGSRRKKGLPVALIGGIGVLMLIGIILLALKMRPDPTPPTPRVALPDAVLVPAGKHPTPDGTEEHLRAFRISPHEVTIREYAEFLETLETLAKDQRERTFDHENQPAEKSSHLPDDWTALLTAAKSGGTWNKRPVSLDSPVVGIDWWDCAAYAEWKQARLPTQEEWFAALRKDVAVPEALKPADWQPVTTDSTDRTPAGLVGMAGSVCEWTRRPGTNPANPLGERKWIIIGGSYLKPGTNALSREWTDDRSLRRPDLGFRLVFDAN